MFITKNDTLLCADASTTLHTVQEIDMQGNVLRTFGTPGVASDTGFDNLALAHAKERGEVTPEDEKDPLLDLNMRLNSIKRAAGPFNRPCGMAVASTGEMFAADGYGNAAIHKFAADGTYLETWGGPAQALASLDSRTGSGLTSMTGCGSPTARIRELCSTRQRAKSSAPFRAVAFRFRLGNESNVFIGELGGGITIVDLEKLEVVAQFGFKGFTFFACHGICGDPQGNIYVTSIKGFRFLGNLLRLSPIK